MKRLPLLVLFLTLAALFGVPQAARAHTSRTEISAVPSDTAPKPSPAAVTPESASAVPVPSRSALAVSSAVVSESAASQAPPNHANQAQPNMTLTELPLGKGLPVIVRAGLYFQDVTGFDEHTGTFDATIDMRLRWEDPRLRYPAAETPRGFREYRGPKAQERMREIWVPGIDFANIHGEPSYQIFNVRVFPDGWVEVMRRATAQFKVKVETRDFPFDKQSLAVEIALRREINKEASLVFLQQDVDFSSAAETITLEDWTPELVHLRRADRPGWYGETHSGMLIGLTVVRHWGKFIGPIFVPLLATLLIPFLVVWMNKIENGEFTIAGIELANIIVGGLFTVIALNFTINSEYRTIASGDNTVTRLFSLNYLALGQSLFIVVVLYRYNLPKRLFGRYIQEELFFYYCWGVPLLLVATAIAVLLAAV